MKGINYHKYSECSPQDIVYSHDKTMPIDDGVGRFHRQHKGKNEYLKEYENNKRQELGGIRSLPDIRRERNYLKSPDVWYKFERKTSLGHHQYLRKGTDKPLFDKYKPYWSNEPIYRSRPNRNRKALIIGERPSLWKSDRHRLPEVPGNMFIDNLRYRSTDWNEYSHVTWNQILDSHKRDIQHNRSNIQTLPQKEAWLASIDPRYDVYKRRIDSSRPEISPRLFGPKKSVPRRDTLLLLRHDVKDVARTMENSSDFQNSDYRKLVFLDIPKRARPPKHLDF